MDNNYNKEIKNQSHDEIDLKKLFLILWGKKYLIITLTLMSAFISVFIVFGLIFFNMIFFPIKAAAII